MYIRMHDLSDAPVSQSATLLDQLKQYIADQGDSEAEKRIEEERQNLARALVVIAENHSAATRSADLTRRLMRSNLYRYIASEFFLNAGPLRAEIRDFMRGVRKSLGSLLCQYESLLLDLRQKPKYMLFVGSRLENNDLRDRRIAQHFLEEHADRKLNKQTPGILVCGRSHGARIAAEGQQKTTRLLLEEAGFSILGVLIVTDDLDRASQRRIDAVWPLGEAQSDSNVIHLFDLVAKTAEYTIVPTKDSPFEFLTDVRNGFSSVSIAQCYEFVVVAKRMQRCK